MVRTHPIRVATIVDPYVEEDGLDWGALLQDLAAIKTIILLDYQQRQQDDEELLAILMAI